MAVGAGGGDDDGGDDDGGGVPPATPLATVTVRVATATLPAPSVTVAVSVTAPSATVRLSHCTHHVDPVSTLRRATSRPLASNRNVLGDPQGAVVAIPTDCAPRTVAPAAG